MKDVPLPDTWTGWRSAAALMTFCGRHAGAALSRAQKGLICWELEKYGPSYCEQPADILATDALAYSAQQLEPADEPDPRDYCRFHASHVLARRGREALNLTLAACGRINACGRHGAEPAVYDLLHDAWVNAGGQATLQRRGLDHHLGADEAQDYADFGVLQPLPDAAEATFCLRAAVAILTLPPGWTEAHALAFLTHASHVADRPDPGPVASCARAVLGKLAPMLGHAGTTDELLAAAEALYDRCAKRRFVVLRAVEDQLMYFAAFSLDERQQILKIVNLLASAELTAFRRAIVTSAMTVLATSERASRRARHCPDRPR